MLHELMPGEGFAEPDFNSFLDILLDLPASANDSSTPADSEVTNAPQTAEHDDAVLVFDHLGQAHF